MGSTLLKCKSFAKTCSASTKKKLRFIANKISMAEKQLEKCKIEYDQLDKKENENKNTELNKDVLNNLNTFKKD